MPNGRSGGFLIRRTDVEQLLRELPDQSLLGRTLGEPHAGPRRSWVDVDAAAAKAILGTFAGTRVWVEEQDHACYILHLDQEVQASGEPDATRWIVVGPDSPLFIPLRERHHAPLLHRLWWRLW